MSEREDRQASVVTILNLKGGVGKTHTAWLLASVAHERQKRVLLMDTDTQGNLTGSFVDLPDGRPTVDVLFDPAGEPDAGNLIRCTEYSHIDIIPAGPQLAPFDLSNQREWERADLQFSLVDPIAEFRPQYDFIVIDCPPRLSLVSFAALCASDYVIVPLEAADWGAQGTDQVRQAVEYVRIRHNRRLWLLGYLVSRFKRTRVYHRTYLEKLGQFFGDRMFATVVADLAEFEKSVTDRIPVTLHAPGSRAAGLAREFFDEVVARIARRTGKGRTSSRANSQTVVAAVT